MHVSHIKSRYVICIKGRLDPKRADWFEALEIGYNNDGDTLIKVDISDQAALFGVLEKIRDMGIDLVSVQVLR